MKFFKKRKDKFVDLTERCNKQQEKISELKQEKERQQQESGLGFFGNLANSIASHNNQNTGNTKEIQNNSSEYVDVSGFGDKKRKLAKRLSDMTNKLEELSNQIYHLQQRIEVLERKTNVGNF